jgi:hypothetical protein
MMTWLTKYADRIAAILSAAFGGIVIFITFSPAKALEGLLAWKQPALISALVLFVFAALRFTYLAGKKSVLAGNVVERDKLIYAANQLHTLILEYGRYNDYPTGPFITQLNKPCSSWNDDQSRIARNEYLDWIKKARRVRNGTKIGEFLGRDFRNEMERNEYELYLTNTRDRLITALKGIPMPARFDPEIG